MQSLEEKQSPPGDRLVWHSISPKPGPRYLLAHPLLACARDTEKETSPSPLAAFHGSLGVRHPQAHPEQNPCGISIQHAT